jgi:hypothetical protein
MKFQVGRFTCELSVTEGGTVLAEWQPETTKYLNKEERAQWRAGLSTFLGSLVKNDPPCGNEITWVKNLLCLVLAAALLTGCARGGGIGLEAMLADHNCEQAGYQLGTPQYGACRMELAHQSAMRGAAAMASQDTMIRDYLNHQPQTCVYNGSNNGGIVGGTMMCR